MVAPWQSKKAGCAPASKDAWGHHTFRLYDLNALIASVKADSSFEMAPSANVAPAQKKQKETQPKGGRDIAAVSITSPINPLMVWIAMLFQL